MMLRIVGCSHHETSLSVRERLAFTSSQTTEALSEFRNRFPSSELVLLSTCNRTELYTAAADDQTLPSQKDVVQFLAGFHGLDGVEIMNELFLYTGEDAIRHLFTVAASLDSMVLGESQILSQVKEAYRLAMEASSAGQMTHAVFQAAIRSAKRVARETTIHHKRISIPSVAVADFAGQIFERLDDKRVLVIGAGEMGQETLRYLMSAGAKSATIVNRDFEKAKKLALEFSGDHAMWEQLDQLLIEADLVLSTTGASEPIVTLERFRAIEGRRYQRPLFILDLAVPRDFDPRIGDSVGVYLYSIDDLAQACTANRQQREKEWPLAERIIDEETQLFLNEVSHQATGSTIRRLKENADRTKTLELQRLLDKMGQLDDEDRQEIGQAFDRLVNKLLHPPLESLREEAHEERQYGLVDALRRLFQLKD